MPIKKIKRILKDRKDRRQFREDILESVAKMVIDKLQKELLAQDKIVTGHMADSWQYDKKAHVVGSRRDGISNVEFGREKGSHVPIEPLIKWCVLKFGMDEGEAKSTAYAVEKKIYAEGIPASRFVKIALEKMSR